MPMESTAAQVLVVDEPPSLLDQLLANTTIRPSQEGYAVARHGVAAFISEILQSGDHQQPVNKYRVDQMITEIDLTLSKQMDVILHQPQFQHKIHQLL